MKKMLDHIFEGCTALCDHCSEQAFTAGKKVQTAPKLQLFRVSVEDRPREKIDGKKKLLCSMASCRDSGMRLGGVDWANSLSKLNLGRSIARIGMQ
jgi:hypothetical protein